MFNWLRNIIKEEIDITMRKTIKEETLKGIREINKVFIEKKVYEIKKYNDDIMNYINSDVFLQNIINRINEKQLIRK